MIKEKCSLIASKLDELYPETKTFLNYETDWQLLFAIILSAQATDISVNQATEKLFKILPELRDYNETNKALILYSISNVGLGKSKASYLIDTAGRLVNQYNGVVPKDRDILMTFKGVGYKTASVFLAEYYDYPYIPVDTHVLRVTHRLGIVPSTYDATKTQIRLEKIFDVTSNIHLHRQLILFGRNICLARNEKCDACPFKSICSYHLKNNKKAG